MHHHETKSVRQQRSETEFIAHDDVWAYMARLLEEKRGPCIPRLEMHAEIEDGLALVTWTEAHFISEAEYTEVVERARALAAGSDD